MLNNKQKKELKGYAVKLKPNVMIGKNTLTDNIIDSINKDLKANELTKISVLQNCEASVSELAIEICRLCKCDLVYTIGKMIIVYKESDKHIYKI